MLEGMDCSFLRKETDQLKVRTCYELQYCVEFFINMKCLGVGDIQQRYDSFLKGDQEPNLNDSMGRKCECTHPERDGAL